MKKITDINRALTSMLGLFLMVVYVFAPIQSSYAHNKVVVIPMAGDDVPADIEPTAPVAKVDPSQTDYTLMASTTIDKITGLEWQREDDNDTKTWNEAIYYCAALTLDGKTDWRLPDIVELQSIVDYGQATAPIIDGVAFPNTNSSYYWSASNRAGSAVSAWLVNFSVGNVDSDNKTLYSYFVRCVR